MRAILYSGNLRTYEHCVKNHARIFGECDVYFSVWDQWGYVDKINDPWHERLHGRRQDRITKSLIEKLTPDCFKIKQIVINSYDDVQFGFELQKNNYLLYQYYKIFDCFSLLEKQYNEIVRMRCDITIQGAEFKDGMLTCNSNIYYGKGRTKWGMNEMIFGGNYEIMNRACRIIENAKDINDELPEKLVVGECFFYKHLEREGLLDKIYYYDFNFRVKR